MKTYSFFLLILLSFQSVANGQQPVTVAVSDQETEVTYDEAKNKKIFKKIDYILPIAQVNGGKWTEASGVLATQIWTVAYNGKNLGTCESKHFKNQLFQSYKNVQRPTGKVPYPDKEKEISTQQLKSHRPLIFVSAPNYQDPDGWTVSKLSPQEKKYS